jgi:hypothetical protein
MPNLSYRMELQNMNEEEHIFKVCMRRNKMLGLWLAEKMGLSDAAALNYAHEVIESDFQKPGFEDVIEKIRIDFEKKAMLFDEQELRLQAEKFFHLAHEEIMKGV